MLTILGGNVASAGTLQVMIQDQEGALVPKSRLYVFSKNKKQFISMTEVAASTSLELPPGRYRVYAGVTKSNQGYYDHYSSPEAVVRVSDEEPISIVLLLRKAEDSITYVSDRTLKKLNIDPELAKHIN